MSLLDSGRYVCDRCGGDVDNGGVYAAATLSMLDAASMPAVRHLCLDRVVPADGEDAADAAARGAEVTAIADPDAREGDDGDGDDEPPSAVLVQGCATVLLGGDALADLVSRTG